MVRSGLAQHALELGCVCVELREGARAIVDLLSDSYALAVHEIELSANVSAGRMYACSGARMRFTTLGAWCGGSRLVRALQAPDVRFVACRYSWHWFTLMS